jgi:hypothetical protein
MCASYNSGSKEQPKRLPAPSVALVPRQEDLDDDGQSLHQCRYNIQSGSEQHYGTLNETNQQALMDLTKLLLEDTSIDKAELFAARQRGLEPWDGFLLRWLRVTKFNVSTSRDMIAKHITWRLSEGVTGLSALAEDQVLQCSSSSVRFHRPVWVAGFSRAKTPILFRRLGCFNAKELLKLTTMDCLVRHHIWEQERLAALVGRKSRDSGYLTEQWVTIMDMKDMSLSQLGSSFMALARACAYVDQAQYPDRNGGMIFINAHRYFSRVWGMLKPLFGQGKMEVYDTDPSSWTPVLVSLLGQDQLLPEYGGVAKSTVCIGAMESLLAPGSPTSPSKFDEAPEPAASTPIPITPEGRSQSSTFVWLLSRCFILVSMVVASVCYWLEATVVQSSSIVCLIKAKYGIRTS